MIWGARASLSLVSGPLLLGLGWTPRFWWLVSEDNPFSSGPIVYRWSRVWWVAGIWAGLSPVSYLKQGPGGLGPIWLGWGWWAKEVEFFSWLAAANKAYLTFLSFSFSFFPSSSLLLKTLKVISRRSHWGISGLFSNWPSFSEYWGLIGLWTGCVATEVQWGWKYLD